jgi:hypothetical protein
VSLHAAFSPSASERWIACPASHLRAAALPPAPSSVYADRGTLLHEYAALGVLHTLREMDEHAEAAGVSFEPDERAAIATYVKFCKGLRKGATLWRVEQRVVHDAELFGTIDFFSVHDGTLDVVDFKGGRGIKVEAIDNPQLLTYAAMVCALVADDPTQMPIQHVNLHIVQPLFVGDAPIRGVGYTIAQIDAWRVKLLQAMLAAKRADAPFSPGEHCRFCPVKPTCPALRGLATALPAPAGLDALPPEKIAEWLAKADVIELWIAALREHAHGSINCGTPIPGWKLVDKRATRKWTDERKVLGEAKEHRLVVTERRLLSPAQVQKKFKTIPVVLAPFIDQTPSGQNLVRDENYVAPESTQEQPVLAQALLNLQYRV